ncbi:restriction endonuclease S subunits-like protein [Acinetobacter pittii PHEA-2]|uniref:Restriction endonuclease S subunits-like protein n=1 Tax=Acinetobacter pittii (strain PHEA-2) TaxID=871585 RepID=F0KG49_ACIP2|nr:restriction endonuclease subunit S [Acinetobacter pittii]YP_004994445.1 restriction endonuclease S subunits-like protein [Acinetobacter pittii PHEA-2]ADY80763.1 restriction endonuclease S subunits-like protein [Acinetobacter pittii PHEA-2]
MSVPKLRFKEFDGAWISTNIQGLVDQNILDKPMDGNHGEIHPTSADYVENGIPFVMATDVFDGNVYLDKSKKITKEQADTLRKGFSIEGDILLTHKATIGNVAKVPKLDTPYIMLTPQVTYYRVRDYEKLVPDFIKSSFESKKFQNELIALCTGATRLYIGISEQRKLPFSYPSKSEQTKIASFLSTVDEKISQLNQKHKLLSQYKQGMMQKLFSQQFRFKADNGGEFGGWVEIKITDVADYVDYRGKTPRKVEDGILLVTAKNIRFGYIDYSISQEYICSDDFDEVMRRGRAEIGDVLITTEAPLGNVASVDRENIALAQRVIKYRGKKGILNNEFLKQKFLSEEFQSLISSKATGGTVQGIKGSTLHNLEINIPEDIEEQTKIANFLATIDQKIEVVAKQIEQAKQWKKGLLQQMFV